MGKLDVLMILFVVLLKRFLGQTQLLVKTSTPKKMYHFVGTQDVWPQNTRPAQKVTIEACKLTLNELNVKVIKNLSTKLECGTQLPKNIWGRAKKMGTERDEDRPTSLTLAKLHHTNYAFLVKSRPRHKLARYFSTSTHTYTDGVSEAHYNFHPVVVQGHTALCTGHSRISQQPSWN